MKQKRVFLLCGAPGSGKTTWVRNRIARYGGYHISRDEIRFKILDERGGDYFDWEDEVIEIFYNNINGLLALDEPCMDIYVDATHLTNKARNQVRSRLDLSDAYVIAVWFDVSLGVCLYRNSLREGRACVPTKTIKDMYARASKPSIGSFDEVWVINAEGERTNG